MRKIFTFLLLLPFLAIPSHAQLNYHQGDVNGDGTIDISDVVSLVNLILNGGTTLTCPDDNHPHAVDLGLPSGTKWACCNVDAPSPEGYGGYFAWGETGVKLVYDWSTYTLCNGTESSCQDIGANIGGTTYDVAHEKWSGFWRMPSSAQFQELLDNCDSEWTMVNGVYGRKFTGKKGCSIFFPSAGFHEGTNLSLSMNYGIYWTCTKVSDDNSRANYFQFSASTTYLIDNPRYAGFPIRPVNVVSLDLSESSVRLTKGNTTTVEVTTGSGNYTVSSSDVSIATVAVSGNKVIIIGMEKGAATITVTDTETGLVNEIELTVTIYPSYLTCPDDHHPHLIDLGLPSGTQWACCNVGADAPESYGGYYAWGETTEKDVYNWSTYIHCDGSRDTCHDLGSDIAGTEYDVAHVQWGGFWVMPSKEQQDELRDKCTYTWTTKNGIKGGQFTGPNGGTIFFPAAGYRYYSDLSLAGTDVDYWSSTQYPSRSYYAYNLYFFSSSMDYYYYYYRGYGRSVRPVVRN